MSEWISTKDELPKEEAERVLVLLTLLNYKKEKCQMVCYWHDLYSEWVEAWSGHRLPENKITHWMPLPNPPELKSDR